MVKQRDMAPTTRTPQEWWWMPGYKKKKRNKIWSEMVNNEIWPPRENTTRVVVDAWHKKNPHIMNHIYSKNIWSEMVQQQNRLKRPG